MDSDIDERWFDGVSLRLSYGKHSVDTSNVFRKIGRFMIKRVLKYICARAFFGATLMNFIGNPGLVSGLSLLSGSCFLLLDLLESYAEEN